MNKDVYFDCEDEDFDSYEEAREFSRERYDSGWNCDDTDYYEDSFYALTDGMCGDYDDGMGLDSVMTYMGLD